ncbi:MAG: diguanylate cyclase [Pseudomonadota bacterium]|nr:diguanylate cyclase [Pseudomonadota bacterium]
MYRRKFYFVVALIVLMVVGFLATSLTSYFVARDSITAQISEQTLPLTSDNIYSEIQRDLLRPVLISSLMATDTFLRGWALAGETDPEQIRHYLEEIQARYDTITAFFVSEKTRNYYHPTGIVKQIDLNDPEDAWYAYVRTMREPYQINVDHDTADRSRLSIFINYRVFGYDGTYIGATGVGLAVSSVTTLIDNYQQRYGRTIYFVDRLGNITLTSGDHVHEKRLQDRPGLGAFATQVLSSPSATLNYRDAAGDTVFLNSRLVPEFDWYLVVEQQGGAADSRMENTLWMNIGLALGIMALVLFAAHFTLRSYQGQLEQMATTDRLTGAANRHVFETLFDHAAKVSQRTYRPFSVVNLDIDFFKKVNDTYGHPGGDVTLKAVADIIKAHVRNADVVCRWGGEEFMLLLEDCPDQEAVERAHRIRMAVKNHEITFGRDRIRITLSCGVAQYRPGESLESLTGRADTALYEAKNEGRDQVRLAD